MEVVHREWTIKPVASKHQRLANLEDQEGGGGGGGSGGKYICRPSHSQWPHTGALLVQNPFGNRGKGNISYRLGKQEGESLYVTALLGVEKYDLETLESCVPLLDLELALLLDMECWASLNMEL